MKPSEVAACRITARISPRHNTWRHKLRRRFTLYWAIASSYGAMSSMQSPARIGLSALTSIVLFHFVLPSLCALAWLRYGAQSTLAATLARWWLWISLPFGLIAIVFGGFMLLTKNPVTREQFGNRQARWWFLARSFVGFVRMALVASSLWNGAITSAVLWYFGLNALEKLLYRFKLPSLRSLILATTATACVVAFALDSQAGFIIAVLADWLAPVLVGAPLCELLQSKLSRSIWLAAWREQARDWIKSMPPTPDGDRAVLMATILKNAELWDEALDILQNFPAPVISQCRRIELRAEILLAMGAPESVLKMADFDRNADFGAPDILAYVARAHAALGRHDEALTLAVRAAEEERKQGDVVLAELLVSSEHWDEAVLRYDALLSKTEQQKVAMRALAQIFMAAGDYRQAAVLWRNSFRWSQYFPLDDVLQLARCHACAGRIRDARVALQLAAERAETVEESQRVETLKHELSPILA